jgi:hypothetical protein
LVLIRSGKFFIYDETRKQLEYCIESRAIPRDNFDVIAYPSKQIIGKLRAQWTWWDYLARFSMLDLNSNQWIDGNITSRGDSFVDKYYIEWTEGRILMKNPAKSANSYYIDLFESVTVATLKRYRRFMTTSEYDLEVYSDKYPQALYLMGVAIWDSLHPRLRRGKK